MSVLRRSQRDRYSSHSYLRLLVSLGVLEPVSILHPHEEDRVGNLLHLTGNLDLNFVENLEAVFIRSTVYCSPDALSI
jgi:hypothetical protein